MSISDITMVKSHSDVETNHKKKNSIVYKWQNKLVYGIVVI